MNYQLARDVALHKDASMVNRSAIATGGIDARFYGLPSEKSVQESDKVR
jgi:hypothetical protein